MKAGADGSELAAALRARYADAPARAGLYESLYFTAHHPALPRALWVRHTVLKPPGTRPRAALWCTWFGAGGVRAAKVTTDDVSSGPGRSLQVGDHGWIGAGGAAGAVDHDRLRARWDLTFRRPEPPMFHLPKPWMYSAPLPRTKSTSAAPALLLGGSLVVDGQPVDVDGWPCTVGHNWGAEHAHRWIWLHADAETEDGRVWLDVVVGRMKVGPVTTPWIANGAVSMAGHRHRLGGPGPRAGTRITEDHRGATAFLRGDGIAVEVRSEIDPASSVAWIYADPAGRTSEVVNSSVARAALRIERREGAALELDCPVSAFELGAPRRTFDVPLQPFAD